MNAPLLKGRMAELSMTQQSVAEKIGLSLSRFNAKLNGTQGAQFTLRDIQQLKTTLNLSAESIDAIFFD